MIRVGWMSTRKQGINSQNHTAFRRKCNWLVDIHYNPTYRMRHKQALSWNSRVTPVNTQERVAT